MSENSLLVRDAAGNLCRDAAGSIRLACACGMVLSGRTQPNQPHFSPGGSFWTSDLVALSEIPSEGVCLLNSQALCLHQGDASMALIPIRNEERIVGLSQLNDRHKGRFTGNTVEILEGIASHLGSALMRKRAEAELIETNRHLEAATARGHRIDAIDTTR